MKYECEIRCKDCNTIIGNIGAQCSNEKCPGKFRKIKWTKQEKNKERYDKKVKGKKQ
jgi:hypothetical protein